MKLLAYVIDGVNIIARGQYLGAELNGNPAFKVVFDGNLPAGYEDVSSIYAWASFGYEAGCDFKQVRAALAALVNQAVWGDLTDNEKLYCVLHFVVDSSKQLEVLGSAEAVKSNGIEYHTRSQDSRKTRVSACEAEIYSSMNVQEAFTLITLLGDLQQSYIKWGLEGIAVGDDMEGLLDYVASTPATSFENAGLLESGLTLNQGVSLEDLRDNMMDILTGQVIYG